jgi:hypothetical protein
MTLRASVRVVVIGSPIGPKLRRSARPPLPANTIGGMLTITVSAKVNAWGEASSENSLWPLPHILNTCKAETKPFSCDGVKIITLNRNILLNGMIW